MSGRLVYVTIKSGKRQPQRELIQWQLQLQLQLADNPSPTGWLNDNAWACWLSDWLRLRLRLRLVAWRTRAKRQQQQREEEKQQCEQATTGKSEEHKPRATGSCKKLQLKVSRKGRWSWRRRRWRGRRKKQSPRSAANVNKKGSHSCQLFRVLFTNASRSANRRQETLQRVQPGRRQQTGQVASGIWQAQLTKKDGWDGKKLREKGRGRETCCKHKYWQHTRMLPQTVKLFRFMNINAPTTQGRRRLRLRLLLWLKREHRRAVRGLAATTKGQPGNTEHSIAFSCGSFTLPLLFSSS